MLAQASATTLHVRGLSNKATASNTFAFGCGHCIFTGHIAKVIVPCDGVGYEATITPATNWAEVGAVTSNPVDPTQPRPACPGLGHPLKTAPPCTEGGSGTVIADPFVVTTTHNQWYVVVNGLLMKSFNADSPPYDPTASSTPSC